MAARSRLSGELPAGMLRESSGRKSFVRMLSQWMERSGWSYQVLAELGEISMTQRDAPNVAVAAAGSYRPGDVMRHNGHIWRCKRSTSLAEDGGVVIDGPIYGKEKLYPDWEHLQTLRRLHASQVNLMILGRNSTLTASALDAFGVLNEWLADIRGQGVKLDDKRLEEKAAAGWVIQDQDGIFGPEEFLSVFLGRLVPPTDLTRFSPEQASQLSHDLGKRIRKAMADLGLDPIDDWARFVAAYPGESRERQHQLRLVSLGQGQWTPEQIESEEIAVAGAIKRLQRQLQRAEKAATE